MKYTLEELKSMLSDGEINLRQYKNCQQILLKNSNNIVNNPDEKDKKIDDVIIEIKNINNILCEIIKVSELLPDMVSAIKEIKIEIPKELLEAQKQVEIKQITKWEISATRNFLGLIEFPIIMKAVE
jgi:hypothetical protein